MHAGASVNTTEALYTHVSVFASDESLGRRDSWPRCQTTGATQGAAASGSSNGWRRRLKGLGWRVLEVRLFPKMGDPEWPASLFCRKPCPQSIFTKLHLLLAPCTIRLKIEARQFPPPTRPPPNPPPPFRGESAGRPCAFPAPGVPAPGSQPRGRRGTGVERVPRLRRRGVAGHTGPGPAGPAPWRYENCHRCEIGGDMLLLSRLHRGFK